MDAVILIEKREEEEEEEEFHRMIQHGNRNGME